MAFQRSYSKVWWGSDNQYATISGATMNPAIHQMLTTSNSGSITSGGLYSYYSQPAQQQPQKAQPMKQQPQYQPFGGSTYHSLDLHQYKAYGNLSRIQEVEDENNISKLSWEKHDSPGSLRSQVRYILQNFFSNGNKFINRFFYNFRILDFQIMKNSTIHAV